MYYLLFRYIVEISNLRNYLFLSLSNTIINKFTSINLLVKIDTQTKPNNKKLILINSNNYITFSNEIRYSIQKYKCNKTYKYYYKLDYFKNSDLINKDISYAIKFQNDEILKFLIKKKEIINYHIIDRILNKCYYNEGLLHINYYEDILYGDYIEYTYNNYKNDYNKPGRHDFLVYNYNRYDYMGYHTLQYAL